MKTILMLVSAAVATTAGAKPMDVIQRDAPPVIRVSYADLNLGSPSGRDRLNLRLITAARTLCINSSRDPVAIELAEKRCFDLTLRDARGQMAQRIESHRLAIGGDSNWVPVIRR